MGRIFSFERELRDTLELVPLTVRRKLDLAELKLSLEGWKALPLEDRRALCDAVVERDPTAFAAVLVACAGRAGARLEPRSLPDGGPPWRSAEVPGPVRARLAELGTALDPPAWGALDDEARYVLLKLAEKQRDPERFASASGELGIGLIPAPAGDKGPAS